MTLLRRFVLPAILVMAGSGMQVGAGESDGLSDAVTAGEAGVELRYRFEHVDQDGFAENAKASTARMRINYGTGLWRSWRAFGEFDYIGEVFVDDFNSGGGASPGRLEYPAVADPEGADLNQLYVEYRGMPGWHWRLGRQRIVLDDQRFIGGVGWRQNEQTFDAISVVNDNLPKTDVFYSFVANVNRVFGDKVAAGDHNMNTHLFEARIRARECFSLMPYAYYIENDDDPASSTATFGLRLVGNRQLGENSLEYVAELATQSDAGNAPVEFDARFLHLDAQWTFKGGMSFGLGLESLSGEQSVPGKAFRTPLATLHSFQGWADQFLVTPDGGIDDIYGKLGYRFGEWLLQATYHDFSAESGNADYGKEIDLSIGRRFAERYGILFKSAHFYADESLFVDTSKFWIMLTADY